MIYADGILKEILRGEKWQRVIEYMWKGSCVSQSLREQAAPAAETMP